MNRGAGHGHRTLLKDEPTHVNREVSCTHGMRSSGRNSASPSWRPGVESPSGQSTRKLQLPFPEMRNFFRPKRFLGCRLPLVNFQSAVLLLPILSSFVVPFRPWYLLTLTLSQSQKSCLHHLFGHGSLKWNVPWMPLWVILALKTRRETTWIFRVHLPHQWNF